MPLKRVNHVALVYIYKFITIFISQEGEFVQCPPHLINQKKSTYF